MAENATLVSVEEARRIVLENVRPVPVMDVDIDHAGGLTLAEDVRCDADAPPFDRAMMDGYAVRSADVTQLPARLAVVGRIAAGEEPRHALGAAQAIQINTGAPLPAAADVVVRVEDTVLAEDGSSVTVLAAGPPAKNIARRGTYATAGQIALPKGMRMGPLQVAVAAAAGAIRLKVYRRPAVSVLVTGDELVDAAMKPRGAQIRDSNGPMLLTLLQEAGVMPTLLGRVGDAQVGLEARIREGLQSDVLCTTGGISMGAYDFVPEALARCGVRIHFRKMATKPGKPALFGTTERGTSVFALPGNPVSAFVAFQLLVRPALAAVQGRDGVRPETFGAVLDGRCGETDVRSTFWPAKVERTDDGGWRAKTLSWGGSGDPFGMAAANALIVRRPHAPAAQPGDPVEVMMIDCP